MTLSSPVSCAAHRDREPARPKRRDRADYEVTQMVPTPVPAAQAQPRPSGTPRTVIDAPPPAVARPLHAQTAERLAASERERRARKRRRGWLAFLLVVMISASAALAGWYLMEGRFTTAPALDSLSRAEAEQVATKVGLSIDFSEAYSETVARGMVISTKPGPGTKILRGAKIEAAVSKGPERYPMPAVVGLSQSAAEAAIEEAKLAVGKVADGYSDQVAAGTVLSASEQPGARLKKRTAINLVVCAGPKPISITDYQGTPYDAASAALTSAGFQVVERSAYSSKVAKDLVLRQDPHSGRAARGDDNHPHQIAGTTAGHRAQCAADGSSCGSEGDAGGRLQNQVAARRRQSRRSRLRGLHQPGGTCHGSQRLDDHPVRGLSSSRPPAGQPSSTQAPELRETSLARAWLTLGRCWLPGRTRA